MKKSRLEAEGEREKSQKSENPVAQSPPSYRINLMSGSKDFRFRPYPLASSSPFPKPRGGPSFNYTLAKDQNGDVLVDRSKTALV